MAYKVYKVERRMAGTEKWYEVMLSPFLTVRGAGRYINDYKDYYPIEDQYYRVLDDSVDAHTFTRLKLFFTRVSKYR
jgi:hypothetical protein